MRNKIIEALKDKYSACFDNKDILKTVVADYEDLVDLRNRFNDNLFFEEDHITLDHVLDYMEVFIDLIRGDK